MGMKRDACEAISETALAVFDNFRKRFAFVILAL